MSPFCAQNYLTPWLYRLSSGSTLAEGKVTKLLDIVKLAQTARPGSPIIVLAAFGNSYSTDGPFLEHAARLALPGGRSALAVMINGGEIPLRYRGLFREVKQEETVDLRPGKSSESR